MSKHSNAAAILSLVAGTAFAHPGHADQSIHLAEWLMGAGVLIGSALVLRTLLRRKHARVSK